MVIASHLYFRRLSYEIFLIIHIIMAVFVLVGSWYHVEFPFERRWGYEFWIYAACAVWFFDRLLRALRVAKVGIRHAKVTEIGAGYVRMDIEGVRWSATPGNHAYAHFPSLSPWTPWENHPFSIIPTSMLRSRNHSIVALGDVSVEDSSSDRDVEKTQAMAISRAADSSPSRSASSPTATNGITLYIKKSKGRTRFLQTHNRLTTLLDGPYPSNPTSAVLQCDRLILIAGGIGVTGVLPWLTMHLNAKLCWSVKDSAQCLVDDLAVVLKGTAEKDVRVACRLDVAGLLEQEAAAGWKKIGVVVCGPGGLCDDVRAQVVRLGREGRGAWELEVDAFTW